MHVVITGEEDFSGNDSLAPFWTRVMSATMENGRHSIR